MSWITLTDDAGHTVPLHVPAGARCVLCRTPVGVEQVTSEAVVVAGYPAAPVFCCRAHLQDQTNPTSARAYDLLARAVAQQAPTAPPPGDLDEAALLEALHALEAHEPMTLTLAPVEAWLVFAQLQLALRHPRNGGTAALVARRLAQELQSWLVGRVPALGPLAAAGWDQRYDR